MQNAKDEQFTLQEDGQIFYQDKLGNPLPGVAVAKVAKGENVLQPAVVLNDGTDADVQPVLEAWLGRHIATVLEPLVALKDHEKLEGPTQAIAEKVYESLGIVPREAIEDSIKDLTPETRADLRAVKIRLGPILVFIPALNKPAAVRLRALLWGLWNDKALPMDCPNDGIVSFEIDKAAVDHAFYQAIAYPVYGSRAIRIDMLDRVICAVYDAAEGGKFQAQHQMAEWLGSSIEGLYEVLEAMGHTKVYDPLEEKAQEELAVLPKGDASEEVKTEDPQESVEETKEEVKPTEQVKPELATFRLKKGKAHQSGERKTTAKDKAHKKSKPKGKRNKSTNRTPKVMSAEAKVVEDSPFAVLQQLKQGSGSDS